ncbi:Wzz/FepE/Etk N-terminal domain-containing protein [Cellulosilyticum sp. I15G10I2]|uniref:Wzz/FepE/Etk N-terminal domain-containing protein n=1 Tax=Cellulosilyticum sp. I15G10I2 TaxID=1892843 RepID=UPI0009F330AF|nr:Wzz/FepE/Etk N-terminal domain-containing protein [Cellulosilyticum sp. I15G10I2]
MDIKKLIFTLWQQKYITIAITLIVAMLSGRYSVFMLSPVYDVKLNIIINMPEIYNTKYGEYTLPITTNEQYIGLITSNNVLVNTLSHMAYKSEELSVERLRKRITISQTGAKSDPKQNSFEIKVSAGSPEEALKLAETLYDNYIKFLDIMTKERAINHFHNSFRIALKAEEAALKSNKELLKRNEALLVEIPQNINQNEALQGVGVSTANAGNYIVVENINNPNHTQVQSDIIILKQTINSIEDIMRLYNEHLEELDSELKTIENYYKTGEVGSLKSSVIGIVETSVYLPSPPVSPSQKTSPKNVLNVAFGIVWGGVRYCDSFDKGMVKEGLGVIMTPFLLYIS